MNVVQKFLDSAWFDLALRMFVVVALPWGVWVTGAVYEFRAFADRGDRFTDVDSLQMRSGILDEVRRIENRIDSRIDRLPPEEWKKQIREARNEARRVELLVYQLEKEFSADFVRKDELKSLHSDVEK